VWRLLQSAIVSLEAKGNPMDNMVNHALEVHAAGAVTMFAIPAKRA
jgi:hypothetical protein